MTNFKPDIKAKITLTDREFVYSGYRPAHLIGDYLTMGQHEYLNSNILKKNETTEGMITFISPEFYPHSLKVGMRIRFQEGTRVTGYIEVLEIYNDILKDLCVEQIHLSKSALGSYKAEDFKDISHYALIKHL